MCTAFIFYYPRQLYNGQVPWICSYGIPAPICVATHESRTLQSVADLDRSFGGAADECRAPEAPPLCPASDACRSFIGGGSEKVWMHKTVPSLFGGERCHESCVPEWRFDGYNRMGYACGRCEDD